MKEEGKQVKNGKAFEYALAITYKEELEKLKEWRPAASETETAGTAEVREP